MKGLADFSRARKAVRLAFVAALLIPLLLLVPASLSRPENVFYVPRPSTTLELSDGYYYYAQSDDVQKAIGIVGRYGGEVWYKPAISNCRGLGIPSQPYIIIRLDRHADLLGYGFKPGLYMGLCPERLIHYGRAGEIA